MRRMRPVATMLALVLALAACTGAAERDQDTGGADSGEITLVFSDWHLSEPVWTASLEEAFEQSWQKEHPDIKVELEEISYAEKETKYITEIEAGAGPDVMHLQLAALQQFMDRGYLMDLGRFIEQEGGDEFTSQWYPETIELTQREGKQYALPGDYMPMVMMYNTELLREAGLDTQNLPTTWDQWLTYAKQATRAREGGDEVNTWGFGTIGAIDPGFELRVSPVIYSHGGQIINAEGTCSALHTPEARAGFRFLVELVTEHKVVPPGVTSQNAGTVREQMANEQVAMAMGTGWTAPIVDGINPELNAFEVLAAAPVPVADPGVETPTTAWLSAWGINPNTKHPEAAWELVKWLTSKEMEQKWFDDNRVLSSRIDVSGARGGDGPAGYDELINDKFAKVVAAQVPKVQFPPQIPELPQVYEGLNVAAQRGFTGDATPDEALKEAHDQINKALGGQGCPPFPG